jgi:phage-related protein
VGSEFTFYDYVDQADVNQIHDWLQTIPEQVKAKLNNRLRHLEATKQGAWKRPLVDTLTEDCDGLFEVRASLSRQQYRILGTHRIATKAPTLLWAFQKNTRRVPASNSKEALEIWAIVKAEPPNRRTEHNYE